MEVIKYSKEKEQEWDDYVEKKAFNGTFMQTRRFINYHPTDRFKDCSILFIDKGNIIAVCPACEQMIEGKKTFYSHAGMTFGGFILSKYRVEKIFELIENFETYIKKNKFEQVILKITPDIFSKRRMSLLEYALQYYRYTEYKELNTFIDLCVDTECLWNKFDRNKKRTLRKAIKEKLTFRELELDNEIKEFYVLLVKNLKKFGANPIHSLEEILDFKNHRLQMETKFYGVFKDGQMLAGGMLFDFEGTGVLHAQNLSADTDFMNTGAISFLYYNIILEAKKNGFKKLSWGISTEDHGAIINKGLIRNKESYGSEYYINRTFIKNIETYGAGVDGYERY